MFDNMSIIVLTQIHRIFVHFSLFWHKVSFFLFSLIKYPRIAQCARYDYLSVHDIVIYFFTFEYGDFLTYDFF